MCEKETKFEATLKKAEESRYVPTKVSTIRAGISAIPIVGGALDHLIFDKADEIRTKNIEKSLVDISEKVNSISEKHLTIEWFKSTEALEMFRLLVEKVQFEDDNQKIKSIADIYAVSGTKEFSKDPNKFAVLRKVAELTTVQKELLLIVSTVNKTNRTFDGEHLTSNSTAIWFDDIHNAVKTNPKGQFWQGTLHLNTELEIIESLNLMRKVTAFLANIIGYELTGLGLLLIKYLKNIR